MVVNKGKKKKKNDDRSSLGGVGGGVKEEGTVYSNKVSGLTMNIYIYNIYHLVAAIKKSKYKPVSLRGKSRSSHC